ncbi:apolipoprotein C-III [Ornithorhynchus anatinus]|uniref:Apolipoprotein C-III n=1 Tax=Ornithorhynchus anatinus TaxID=9258 RepID=A0A6I8P8K9_ORNAN|nr:apolipoprotein C-III [Ornithorhynchus anatinus]
MQPRVFSAAALLTLLLVNFAWAEEPSLVGRVQDYVHHMAQTAKEALTNVQESQAAQKARGWVSYGFDNFHGYLSLFKDKFSDLWDQTPVPSAPPTTAPLQDNSK